MNLRVWLAGLDPAVLDVSTFGLLALEGAGIPGIPGVVPMLAQVAAIDAGHTTLGAAIAWGVAGNWLGSLLGYAVSRWGGRWLPAGWRERLAGERNDVSVIRTSHTGLKKMSLMPVLLRSSPKPARGQSLRRPSSPQRS